jgi:hypothetical protein
MTSLNDNVFIKSLIYIYAAFNIDHLDFDCVQPILSSSSSFSIISFANITICFFKLIFFLSDQRHF